MNWVPLLEPEMREKAAAAARDVAARLRIRGQAEQAAEIASGQTWFPVSTRWLPWSVSQGNAGLAILWSYMDTCFAGEDWDLIGREDIFEAGRSAETTARIDTGLFGGLAGLAFAACQLSRGGTRYGRLLATLDSQISSQILELATRVDSRRDGIPVSEFDAISGLAGVGAYLLLRRGQATTDAALRRIAETLTALVLNGNGVPRWHTPVAMLWDERTKEAYPNGFLNCGLAHGIPGVLAFLAIAARQGAANVGLREAIAAAGDWLAKNRLDDQWGVNWPTAVPLALVDNGRGPKLSVDNAVSAPNGPGRCAWCYGSPGIARTLWLAGEAIDDAGFRELAISAMECVYRRPISARQIDSLTFCHGVAGLLQITMRFAHDTGLPIFTEQGRLLASQILAGYRPETLLGFRDLETAGNEIDQPGLLDGACGIALVLLAAAMPFPPVWDRLFLLS